MNTITVDVAKSKYPYKWYKDERFPLLPTWRIRQADKHNTWSIYFSWIGFRFWTMDSPDIGFSFNLDDSHLELRGRIPYLIFGFFIPVFPRSFHQKIWRKAKWLTR